MKKLSLICFSLCFFSNSFSQAVIKGLIHGNVQQIALLEPIMGYSQQVISRPDFIVKVDKNNYFEKVVILSRPATLVLKIGFEPIYLFVEPNDTISLEVDLAKFTKSSLTEGLIIKGRNATGNIFFNQYNYNPGNKFLPFKNLLDSANFYSNLNWFLVNEGLNKAKNPFKIMLKEKRITSVFYNSVTKGITGILLTSITSKLLSESSSTSIKNPLKIVEEMYKRYPVNIEDLKETNFGNLIAYHFYRFKQSKKTLKYQSSDTAVFINSKKYIVKGDFAYWLFAPDSTQEFLWALHLLNLKRLFPQSFTTEDIKTYLHFHPNSKMKAYLQAPYFPENFKPSNLNDLSKIFFIKDSMDTTLQQVLLNHFEGKRVLIDFWATWCSPCKSEFVHNNFIDSILQEYDIQKLYISIDLPNFKDELLSNIYRYNLKGYHLHASFNLQKSISNMFGDGGQFGIPRYMLVDQDGKIINNDMFRPSLTGEFLNDIKVGFNIKK